MSTELTPTDLKFRLDEKKLKCKTTENLTPLKGIIGQSSKSFKIRIKHRRQWI
jgi:hypothetical protein